MWISDNWNEYELLDCGAGERLERWGSRILVRPDPQAVWDSPREHAGWNNFDARYSRSSSGGGSWSKNELPPFWKIGYGNLSFNIKPMNFKHTGIFPEQAANWDWASKQIREAKREISVLNLFGYTGCATLAAAEAGAAVCHVDAARGMVAWGRENAQLSGLADRPVRWIIDDCAAFVEREIKRGRRYDAIMMDPPSYGRGPSGEVWKNERQLFSLISQSARLLSDAPLFFLVNSYTSGLSPAAVAYMTGITVQKRFGGNTEYGELGLRCRASGLPLPCGASTRWTNRR